MCWTRGVPTLAAVLLLACAVRPRVTTMTATEIAAEVSVERSPTKHIVTYSGMHLGSSSLSGGIATEYYLRSFLRDDTTRPTHQLYVARQYQGSRWIHYELATDDTGSSRSVTVIGRDFGSCSSALNECIYYEHVTVELPDAFLRTRAGTGLQIRVTGETGRGAFVVDVPGNYVQGQLAALSASAQTAPTP